MQCLRIWAKPAPRQDESDPTRKKSREGCVSHVKIRTVPQRERSDTRKVPRELRERYQNSHSPTASIWTSHKGTFTRAGADKSGDQMERSDPTPAPAFDTYRKNPSVWHIGRGTKLPKNVPNYFDGTFLRCALFHLVEAKARGNGSQPWRSCSKCPCRGWNLGPQKADHQREPRRVWGAVLLISGL